ncbi:glycoside hydrolase superfamily [Aspergillus coremiiformis]|uniref:Glycoside hydrolase superfamily n=1 Tax=Aspergillus coremiiformis TaxID=138285 RepID=A0A5N6Z4F2_9EURO|nr:glycoside hydrolase superfamily [Aspergillus coremiiformis]
MLHWLSFLLLSNLVVAFAASISTVPIPLPNSPRVLRRDLYGYSIEPSSVAPYLQSRLASKLLGHISEIAGVPAPIRVGGNTADQTLFDRTLRVPFEALPNDTTVEVLHIRKDWFQGWKEYFPRGTNFLYTLNLRNETGSWMNAMEEAKAAMGVLGDSVSLFELGNEIDHYIQKGWRDAGWDTKQYTKQWYRLTGQILSSEFYKNATHKPVFQAAVFADPPMVPDQQTERDDFDIINVTRAGLVNPKMIDTYAVHLYPQSTCDAVRRARLSLNLLSDHHVVWRNLSQYIPQEAAARAAGSRLVLGETNSVSCSGRSGISDTFGAALWATDYVLTSASMGIERVYFHLGHQSEYSAFTPLPYDYQGERLTAGVRANFFSHLFLAHVVASRNADPWKITALPAANASDFSGYAIFDNESSLAKLVFIDLGVWNSTSGRHNPSTLSSTDSTSTSPGTRPRRTVKAQTPWNPGTLVEILRLQGPGSNAKSGVNVSGVGVDPATGQLVGPMKVERGIVNEAGIVHCNLLQAEAVLIQKLSRRSRFTG